MRAEPIHPSSNQVLTEQQFRQVYDAYFAFVWRCLRGLGVAEPQLDDAAQEVFVVVHRRLAEFRGDSSVRTWLYSIVRGVAANHRRSKRRKESLHAPQMNLIDSGLGPERSYQQQQQIRFVESFVDTLSEERRDVFVLAMIDQMPVPEVAETLGIPLNTAYTRLRAVRLEFQKALKRLRDPL